MSRALTGQEPSLVRTSFSSQVGNVLSTLPASTSVSLMRKLVDSLEPIPLPRLPDDLFTLQDQVVLKAFRMLQVQPSGENALQLKNHGTTVVAAYDLYVQGIGYLQRYERLENVESAIVLFQRAIKEDHNYAQ